MREFDFGIYLRRSSEDNEDKQMRSIEGQEQDLKEIIEKFGLKVIKFYPPESQTAFKKGRPIFNSILIDAENQIINALLVWHANRVARNYGDGGDFVQLMSEGKMQILLTPHGYFENTPRDKAYLMGEFTRATEDSDEKSLAVKRGNKTKLKLGYIPNGRLSEAYIHIRNENYHMINDKDPDRFPLIQKAIRLILEQSHTPMEALDILNNQWGYRTRKTRRMGDKPMAKSTFYKILGDFKSAGMIKRSEGEFKASFPTLIDMEEFNKLQVILGKKDTRRKTKKNWAYDGKEIVCGECGSGIIQDEKWHIVCSGCKTKFNKTKIVTKCPECNLSISEMRLPKIYHFVWVYCSKKKRLPDGSKCKQKYLKVKDFEGQIDYFLSQIEIPQAFSDWAIKWLQKLNGKEISDRTTINKNLQNLYNDIQKQIDNLLDLLLKKLISQIEYQKKKEFLLAEKEELKKKLNSTEERANNWLELTEKTFNFSVNARHWFANGTPDQKRMILKTIGSDIILKDKKISLKQREPFLMIKKMKEENEKDLQKFGHKELSLTNAQSISPDLVNPSLLGGRDSNPDKFLQRELSYR